MGGRANKEGTVLWRLTGVARDGETQVDFTKDNRIFIAPARHGQAERGHHDHVPGRTIRRTGQAGACQFLPPSGTVWAEQRPHHSRSRASSACRASTQFNTEITTSLGYLLSHDFNDDADRSAQNLRYA